MAGDVRRTARAVGAAAPDRIGVGLRAALAVVLPLGAGVAAGRPALGAAASFRDSGRLYVPRSPYRYRARVVGRIGVGLVLAVLVGSLAAGHGAVSALVAGLVAAVGLVRLPGCRAAAAARADAGDGGAGRDGHALRPGRGGDPRRPRSGRCARRLAPDDGTRAGRPMAGAGASGRGRRPRGRGGPAGRRDLGAGRRGPARRGHRRAAGAHSGPPGRAAARAPAGRVGRRGGGAAGGGAARRGRGHGRPGSGMGHRGARARPCGAR